MALREEFFPSLFLGAEVDIPSQTTAVFLVKHVWLAIPDLNQTAQGNWTTSCMVTRHLVTAYRSASSYNPGTTHNSQLMAWWISGVIRDGRQERLLQPWWGYSCQRKASLSARDIIWLHGSLACCPWSME